MERGCVGKRGADGAEGKVGGESIVYMSENGKNKLNKAYWAYSVWFHSQYYTIICKMTTLSTSDFPLKSANGVFIKTYKTERWLPVAFIFTML